MHLQPRLSEITLNLLSILQFSHFTSDVAWQLTFEGELIMSSQEFCFTLRSHFISCLFHAASLRPLDFAHRCQTF